MLRHSARSLLRRPALLLALILSVALGVGSNAAVFAFVSGLVGQRSPLVDRDARLVTVRAQAGGAPGLLSGDELGAIRAAASVFESVAAAREAVSAIRSDKRTVTAAVATLTSSGGELFQLGISDGAALSPAARKTLGKVSQVTIDGIEHRTPATSPDWLEGLYIGRPIAAWVLVDDAILLEDGAGGPTLAVFARLRPGVSIDDATAALDAVHGPGRFVVAGYTGLTPEAAGGLRRLGVLLTAAAAAVLLIAGVNVAVLLLSRASRRSHEMSIRIALGVTRRTLAVGLLLDAVLVVVPGAVAGLIAGVWTAGVIPVLLFEQDAAQLAFAPDTRSAVLAVLACAVIVIGCGMLPLIENRHDRPAEVLRRQAPHRRSGISRLQGGLVVVQMAGCCALVVTAALLLHTFQSTLRTQSARGIGERILANVDARTGHFRADLGQQFFRQVEASAAALPGVFATAWIARPPGSRPSWHSVSIEPPPSGSREVHARLVPFTPDSIDDVVLPPLEGRMFGGGDVRDGCRVAVLNAAAASAWFDGGAAGRSIESRAGDRFEIVGVVRDVRPQSPLVYFYPAQGEPHAAGTGAAVAFDIPTTRLRRGVLNANAVSDGYFNVMGGAIRDEAIGPGSATACRTGVLNQAAADLYFNGAAVGGAVIDASGQRTTIAGVVEEPPLRATQRDAPPTIYARMEQEYSPRMTLILAAREAPPAFVAATGRQLNGIAGGSVATIATLDEHLSRTALAAERISAVLVAAATVTALALGVLGLHRAVADDLVRRQQEFATRSALGSQTWRLVPVLMRQGARWAAAGAVLGLLAAALIGVWLRGLTGFDGSYAYWAWLTGPAVLAIGVLLASVLPAFKVMRVDPLIVMRTTA
jgi:putative ABC transport system permease protein